MTGVGEVLARGVLELGQRSERHRSERREDEGIAGERGAALVLTYL